MAIIYTYPIKGTPASGDDLIIISDSENENITKQIRVSQLPGGSSAGVTSIIQGPGILVSSTGPGGTGNVTISSGSGSVGGTGTFNTIPKWDSTGFDIEDSMASQSVDGSIFTIKSGDNADPSLKSPTLRIQNTSDSNAWANGDVVGAIEFYNTDGNRLNAYIKNINQVGPSSANGGLTFGGSQYDAGLVGNINLVELGSLVPDTRIVGGLSTGYGTIFTVNAGPGDDSRLFVPKIRTQINWQGTWIPYQKLSEIQFFSNESGTGNDRVEAYIHSDTGASNGAIPQGEISFGISTAAEGSSGDAKEAVRIQGDGTTVFERNLPLTITTTGTPSATLATPQQIEMISTTGAGLQAYVNDAQLGTMYVKQIGNGRYVDGEAITPKTPFIDGNGNAVTGLTFTVQTNASSGNVKIQGDLYDKNDTTGIAGQVLSSTGAGNGVDWIDFNGGGTVTEVDSGVGLITTPIAGITTTGSVSLRYVSSGGENNILNFIDVATTQQVPDNQDFILFSDQSANPTQVYKTTVSQIIAKNSYQLPPAGSNVRGGIKIGFPQAGRNYPVELSSEQAYVNVPWVASSYVLPEATTGNLGGVLIGFTKSQSARNYPLQLTTANTLYQAFVNIDVMTAATASVGGLPGLVPSSVAGDQLKFLRGDATWATISNSGILGITGSSKASGPEITFNGSGVSQNGNTFTFTSTTITSSTQTANANSGRAITANSTQSGAVTIDSYPFTGGGKVGHVPAVPTEQAPPTLYGTIPDAILTGTGSWKKFVTSFVASSKGTLLTDGTNPYQFNEINTDGGLTASYQGTVNNSVILKLTAQTGGNVTTSNASSLKVPTWTNITGVGNDLLSSIITAGTSSTTMQGVQIAGLTDNGSGTVTNQFALEVSDSNSAFGASAVVLIQTAVAFNPETYGGPRYVAFKSGSTFSGGIEGGSTITVNPKFFASSDYRLKTNINSYHGGLEKISNLRPVTYEEKANLGQVVEGFIAHEVQEHIPKAVNGVKDAVDENGEDIIQTLSIGSFMIDVVSAIKELKDEVDSLKAEIKSLKK